MSSRRSGSMPEKSRGAGAPVWRAGRGGEHLLPEPLLLLLLLLSGGEHQACPPLLPLLLPLLPQGVMEASLLLLLQRKTPGDSACTKLLSLQRVHCIMCSLQSVQVYPPSSLYHCIMCIMYYLCRACTLPPLCRGFTHSTQP